MVKILYLGQICSRHMYLFIFPYLSIWMFDEPDAYQILSDEELVGQYQRDRDQLIIAILIQRHSDQLAVIQYSFTKDRSSFEDFAQDLFTRLSHQLASVDIQSSFRQWLIWWSKNRLIDQSRRKSTKGRVYNSWARKQKRDDSPAYEEEMDHQSLLQEAMMLLSEEEQLCIKGFYLEDKSYQEIVAETGLTFKTVSNRIARGRAKLQKKLGKQLSTYFQ